MIVRRINPRTRATQTRVGSLATMAQLVARAAPLPLAHTTRPWSFGPSGAAWHDALKHIAMHADASTFPPGLLLDADAYTYTMCDGYAKAQYHFLILPRVPFFVDVKEGEKRKRVEVPVRDLESMHTLLRSKYAAHVLRRLRAAKDRVRASANAARAAHSRIDARGQSAGGWARCVLPRRTRGRRGRRMGRALRLPQHPVDAPSAPACTWPHAR